MLIFASFPNTTWISVVSGFVHRNWGGRAESEGNFCLIFLGMYSVQNFLFPRGFLFTVKLAGLDEGYRFPVLVSVGLASQQPWCFQRERQRVESPKRLSLCIPAVLLTRFLGEKKDERGLKKKGSHGREEGSMRGISQNYGALPMPASGCHQ